MTSITGIDGELWINTRRRTKTKTKSEYSGILPTAQTNFGKI